MISDYLTPKSEEEIVKIFKNFSTAELFDYIIQHNINFSSKYINGYYFVNFNIAYVDIKRIKLTSNQYLNFLLTDDRDDN